MIHIDSLAIMDDEELGGVFKGISRSLSRTRDRNKVYQLQVDMCYVQREIHIRKSRKEAHEKYMSQKRS